MLRQFLILWSVISMLGYGLAAVADIHTHTPPDVIYYSDSNIHSHVEVQTDIDSLNDHCSHAGMHMVGLIGGFGIHVRSISQSLSSPITALTLPGFSQSLLRPPRFS